MAERITTVIVCVNRRFRQDAPSCAARGSEAIADAVERGIREHRINVRLERQICLGHCTEGPTVRLAPGGDFLLGTRLDNVPGLLDRLRRECGIKEADSDESGPPAHLIGS